jgi:hypothetical protein
MLMSMLLHSPAFFQHGNFNRQAAMNAKQICLPNFTAALMSHHVGHKLAD